jgi:hypothetical protein
MKTLCIEPITLAYLQINNESLACDFSDFHKAVEEVLDRKVMTHQFGSKYILIKKGMYEPMSKNMNLNLCNEVIKEIINKKFKEYCTLQNFGSVSKE